MKTLWKNIRWLWSNDLDSNFGWFQLKNKENYENQLEHAIMLEYERAEEKVTPMPTLFTGPHHQHYDSVRAISELSRNGYITVEKLAATHPAVIEAIDGIGPKTMGYIHTRMVQEGFWQ